MSEGKRSSTDLKKKSIVEERKQSIIEEKKSVSRPSVKPDSKEVLNYLKPRIY